MFDAIADRYDFLNHLLSAGVERRWRRRAITALSLTGRERVLDLCTGTGDLAIAAMEAQPGARWVVGVDFAHAMLDVARQKLRERRLDRHIHLARGDATRLPVVDGTFDAITIAFGIRNVEDIAAACHEMWRVLAPGGSIAILEFAMPSAAGVKQLYRWYFTHILPRVGRLVSRSAAAYDYLPASVDTFASPDQFVRTLLKHGFVDVSAVPLTFGIAWLYTGKRG
jgi:demethylmenaquinone methyltransferase/2-methoxy-6-polyprenyl-1,4-benzoquinol methylase